MTTMINGNNRVLLEGLGSAEPLLYRQTVPPRLVHRVNGSDVFVTDLRVTGFNTFQVGVRWPASHGFFGPATPNSHDPLLFLESVRQAGLIIAHLAFEIPREFKFITHEKQFGITPAGLRTNGTEPVDVLMVVTAHDIRRRGKGFAGMLFEFKCFRDGIHVGSAAYRWSCVSAAGYARLRGRRTRSTPSETTISVPVAPHRIGRTDDVDVMLAETPGARGWLLRMDPQHPVVFDHHPIDHLYGNVAAEVARQAAQLVLDEPHALPIRGEFLLQRYIEFDTPCMVFADRAGVCNDGATSVRIAFEQDGQIAAEGTLEMLDCG